MSPTDDLIRTEASRSAGNQIARKRFHMFKADANNFHWGGGGGSVSNKKQNFTRFYLIIFKLIITLQIF